jgi:hypothetical protein
MANGKENKITQRIFSSNIRFLGSLYGSKLILTILYPSHFCKKFYWAAWIFGWIIKGEIVRSGQNGIKDLGRNRKGLMISQLMGGENDYEQTAFK